jgi:hypothetical protein
VSLRRALRIAARRCWREMDALMRLRRIGRKIRVFANCLRASSARRPGN